MLETLRSYNTSFFLIKHLVALIKRSLLLIIFQSSKTFFSEKLPKIQSSARLTSSSTSFSNIPSSSTLIKKSVSLSKSKSPFPQSNNSDSPDFDLEIEEFEEDEVESKPSCIPPPSTSRNCNPPPSSRTSNPIFKPSKPNTGPSNRYQLSQGQCTELPPKDETSETTVWNSFRL